MPNIITHVLFADEFIDGTGESVKEWMEPRRHLIQIGANGPDFLFFHGYSPRRILQNSPLPKLGNTVHARHISEFYQMALACIRKEKDDVIRKDMIAYTCGHLMHWALDSTAHPYVYYRTGHGQGKNSGWHHRFESLIDAIMLKVKREQTIKDFKAYEIPDASLEEVRAIARIYVPIARNIYGVPMKPHQVIEAKEDWAFMQKVFYDQSGNKTNFSRNIEDLFRAESMLSGFFVPNTPEDPFDTMNLMHKEWCHPCKEELVSTDSFFDLYDQAMDKAFQVITLFLCALDDEAGDDEFLTFIGQKDYNTGLDENLPMKAFKPVYNNDGLL